MSINTVKISVAYCVELESYISINRANTMEDPGKYTWRCKEDVRQCSARVSFRKEHTRIFSDTLHNVSACFVTKQGFRHKCGVANNGVFRKYSTLEKSISLPFLFQTGLTVAQLLRTKAIDKLQGYESRIGHLTISSFEVFLQFLRSFHYDYGLDKQLKVASQSCRLKDLYFPCNEDSFKNFLSLAHLPDSYLGPTANSQPILVLEGIITSSLLLSKHGKPFFHIKPAFDFPHSLRVFFNRSDHKLLMDEEVFTGKRLSMLFLQLPHVKTDSEQNFYSINGYSRFCIFDPGFDV